MSLAGSEVPAAIESYSFFYLESAATMEKDVRDLKERFESGPIDREYVGIAGPDSEANRLVVQRAINASAGRDLRGLTLIYLGPEGDASALHGLVDRTGANLRYVVYPGRPSS